MIQVPNFGASVVIASTIDTAVAAARKHQHNGFAARFLWIEGRRRTGDESGVEPDTRAALARIVESLAAVRSAGIVSFTPEAHAERRAYFEEVRGLEDAYGETRPGLAAHFGKLHGVFARLALTLHGIDCAARNHHPAGEPISGVTAGRARRLLSEYLQGQIIAFWDRMDSGERPSWGAQAVAEHVLAKGWQRVTHSTIASSLKAWRHATEQQQRAVLHQLVGMGWLRPVESRSTIPRWDVNPRVHAHFAEMRSRVIAAHQRVAEILRPAKT